MQNDMIVLEFDNVYYNFYKMKENVLLFFSFFYNRNVCKSGNHTSHMHLGFFQFSNIMKYVWICIKDCNMLSNFSWIYWNWNFNLFVIWYVCVYQLPIKDNIPVFNLFPLRKISYIFILHSTVFFYNFEIMISCRHISFITSSAVLCQMHIKQAWI